ncbi:nucleotide pyrophosphohydrolase [Tannockella kyphosi]|uniref:nucleotide pyrophosphohydrolase n=1 Tax=Tannockella kyphosi TaxID=2899121 RepID=UPI0020122C1E|nr:nucleotide pyrophosphohydrolase [Tannockella kyphosi]
MQDVTKQILEFTSERNWDQFHTPENLAKSISIEAAELLECYQWNSNGDIQEIKEELADIMNYSLLLCSKLGLDPKEIILEKLEKNKAKYPVEKCFGKSDKYTKL